MLKIILRDITSIRMVFTIVALFLGAHDFLLSFSSFSVFYIAATMSGGEIPAKYGQPILIFLGIYLLLWIISPILLRVKSRMESSVGIIGVIVLNVCDMVSCVFSFLELQVTFKVINFVFSALIIVLAFFSLKQRAGQGDGSVVPSEKTE